MKAYRKMQNKQLKRPYFPPEITAVEFRVERGLTGSEVQVHDGNGVKAFEQDEFLMMFISSQQNSGARMGDQMGYFGNDSWIRSTETGTGSGYGF